jgi:GT2 family glycosyltransferase
MRRTEYPQFQIVVVDNDSRRAVTRDYLADLQKQSSCVVLERPGAFNFAALCNCAVLASSADVVVLLNNDTDVIHRDWLREMVAVACQPDAGCVGALLLYTDDRIQHAGIVIGGRAVARNALSGYPLGDVRVQDQVADRRAVRAVSGACLAIRRHVYLELGGMDENLPVAYNDVDLCLAAEAAGYLNLFTPFAKLYHFEGQSRGRTRTLSQRLRLARDRRYLRRKWGARLSCDPLSRFSPSSDRS